ncbi:MAG: hypothetical protein ABIK07_00900 [Planctomycetota bacterium]
MFTIQKQAQLAGVIVFGLLITACGNQSMVDQSESVEISGIVTLDGKPLSNAEVVFAAADNDPLVGPSIVVTDKKGQYSVSVNAPREYKINIDRMLNGAPNPALKEYQGAETSLKAEVTNENKTFNFDLKSSK